MTAPRRASLDPGECGALRNIVAEMRTILTRELRRSLDGTFGIRVGVDEPEDPSRLRLGPDELEARAELLGVWDALGRRADLVVREAAFTHVNRLISIRVAEAIGLLPESLRQGRRSAGFRQLLEVAPLLGSDDDAGYWAYLQLCGDELAHDVPRLFDPRNPLLALRPPPAVVDELVGLLVADDLGMTGASGSAWAAPDTLGWTYQFFNSDEERAGLRRQSPQPLDSWELAVRNQFFTPDYVVGFLVHNTLGRRLVENGFGDLADDLEYLVDIPGPGGAELDLGAVRVLDPACGSGHFLLGAYDVLERAWELRGVAPAEASPAIVASLWGIDIDARAAQVAAAAVIFRARRDNLDRELPVPNIICARAMPVGRERLLATVDASRRDFLSDLVDALDRAPELGSLLRVEELLSGETARQMTFGGGRGRSGGRATLADAIINTGLVDVRAVVEEVLAVAQAAADDVVSSPAARVLAADGGDALRLVEALAQRYDAVLMNPPFGEPIPSTKADLKRAYPWLPTKDGNLLAAFVGRGLELCLPEGYVGAITSRAGMFLSTFERWRREVLLGNDLRLLADLGHGVMHDALVEAAAYVVRPGRPRDVEPTTFIRLLREPSAQRPRLLRELCGRLRDGGTDERVFEVPAHAFEAVPGAPMAYWMSPDIRRLFADHPTIEDTAAEVRVGLQTGEDFRFVRTHWEVDPAQIARTREETFEGRRWVPFAKGGEYGLFWSDVHLLLDYADDGRDLRGVAGARPQNLQFFFRPGVTWPRRTASGFSPRVLPAGCAFGDKGPAAVASAEPLVLLAWLASQTAAAALAVQLGAADETTSGGASKSYEVGLVAKLPWPAELEDEERVADLAARLVWLHRARDERDETCSSFRAPADGLGAGTVAMTAERLWEEHERDVLEAISISDELEDAVRTAAGATAAAGFVAEEMGPHPASLPRTDLPDAGQVAELFGLPLEQAIAEVRGRGGSQRVLTQKNYVADRLIEVLAHANGVHPEVIVAARRAAGVLPAGHIRETALRTLSYLVGCAFGRWDVRVGRDPTAAPPLPDDPFAPLPLAAPGMLVATDGLPAKHAPSGYPLAFPEHRVLVDEAEHPADIGAAIEAAATALVDDPRVLDELCGLLGADDLRGLLRRAFFRDHLSRYSKSRRKAPLYWPLTTSSHAWTVWVYAPALTREAIYVVAAHAERRLNAAEVSIRRMESAQLQASVPDAPTYDPATARSLIRRLDTERRLAEELRGFHQVVARIAESGWVPNLDDGIVLCAAPFAEVMPDWPEDLVATRARLRAGKLAWASIHEHRAAL